MKKLTSLIIIALIAIQVTETKAQNLQVLYDFECGCVTSGASLVLGKALNTYS